MSLFSRQRAKGLHRGGIAYVSVARGTLRIGAEGFIGGRTFAFAVAGAVLLLGCAPKPRLASVPVPPPTEMMTPMPQIRAAIRKHEASIENATDDALKGGIDATLRQIAADYGAASTATLQAYTETGILLTDADKPALAVPYLRRTLELSRKLLGENHRETGYALTDLAVALERTDAIRNEAEILSLHRAALAARRAALPANHPEIAGSEAMLCETLMQRWRRSAAHDVNHASLTEAKTLAQHAYPVLVALKGQDHHEPILVMRHVAEIELLRHEFAAAERDALRIVPDGGVLGTIKSFGGGPSGDEILRQALVAQQRGAEFDGLMAQARQARLARSMASRHEEAKTGKAIALAQTEDDKDQEEPKPVKADAAAPSGDAASAGCGAGGAKAGVVSATWVHTDVPLYWFDEAGRLHIGGFDGRTSRVVATHDLRHGYPETFVSANHRWILYGGWMTDGKTEQYWLFDTNTQRERQVINRPMFGIGEPQFSPDGRWLAYFASYDDRWPKPEGMGLYLIDTQTGRSTFKGYPPRSAIGPMFAYGTPLWAPEGEVLLLTLINRKQDALKQEFYQFDLSRSAYVRVDGRRRGGGLGETFLIHGRAVEPLRNPPDRSRTSSTGPALHSDDRSLVARIDSKLALRIGSNGTPGVVVDQGREEDCEGVTIGMMGWVGRTRYFVYRNSDKYWLYDPISRQKGMLVSDGEPLQAFTW